MIAALTIGVVVAAPCAPDLGLGVLVGFSSEPAPTGAGRSNALAYGVMSELALKPCIGLPLTTELSLSAGAQGNGGDPGVGSVAVSTWMGHLALLGGPRWELWTDGASAFAVDFRMGVDARVTRVAIDVGGRVDRTTELRPLFAWAAGVALVVQRAFIELTLRRELPQGRGLRGLMALGWTF